MKGTELVFISESPQSFGFILIHFTGVGCREMSIRVIIHVRRVNAAGASGALQRVTEVSLRLKMNRGAPI